MLNSDEGEKIKKILAADGNTQCGNGSKTQKANHIVSAVDENGCCLGEKRVNEKTNEITAIPDLLSKCAYTKTVEKARGGVEKREYWQTEDIWWLAQGKDWVGLKSIAMTRNSVIEGNAETSETRYFISSLSLDIKEVARAIRGHWMVESYHWHLDVTFREDDNHTIEKQAAFNLNIMRKLALHVLRVFDTGKKYMSLRMKRFAIGTYPVKHLESILNLRSFFP